MSYLEIDKTNLINLNLSLKHEMVRSNRAGSYASTTLIYCNTRKYHGLLVCPVPELDHNNHVLLSSLDETIIQHHKEFRLGIHKYPGDVWEPGGHKYAMSFKMDPAPTIVYRVGGVKLQKEVILIENEERILLKYTLLDAHSKTTLRLQPFLAFRNSHSLSKENLYANTRFERIPGGIKLRLYETYPFLHMQLSKKAEFVSFPNWYKNIEYIEEQKRGYDFREDLFVPGSFEVDIEKGESIIFSAGTKKTISSKLFEQFDNENKHRLPRDSFHNNLVNAAQQFIVHKGKSTEIIAGFPWFGRWGRDTFISLPGLTLSVGDVNTCKNVLDTMSKELSGPLFPNIGSGENVSLNSVDAPLWYFWALQQYLEKSGDTDSFKKLYWEKMKIILKGYKEGTSYNIHMAENGLIWAGEDGKALTWMDAVYNGVAVTPRIGFNVEINALWYNAIMFSLKLAKKFREIEFIEEWSDLPAKISESFINTFWDDTRKYLADFVDKNGQNWDVRPNQIFAVSLPFTMITTEMKKNVVEVVKRELLTSKGLRTLSPKNIKYKGEYYGNQEQRDKAYHQGTVWPWLFGHFAEAYINVYKESGVELIKKYFKGFEGELYRHGLGTISEVYDGDPPHNPGGTISQAWSVSELLRVENMLEKYNN